MVVATVFARSLTIQIDWQRFLHDCWRLMQVLFKARDLVLSTFVAAGKWLLAFDVTDTSQGWQSYALHAVAFLMVALFCLYLVACSWKWVGSESWRLGNSQKVDPMVRINLWKAALESADEIGPAGAGNLADFLVRLHIILMLAAVGVLILVLPVILPIVALVLCYEALRVATLHLIDLCRPHGSSHSVKWWPALIARICAVATMLLGLAGVLVIFYRI